MKLPDRCSTSCFFHDEIFNDSVEKSFIWLWNIILIIMKRVNSFWCLSFVLVVFMTFIKILSIIKILIKTAWTDCNFNRDTAGILIRTSVDLTLRVIRGAFQNRSRNISRLKIFARSCRSYVSSRKFTGNPKIHSRLDSRLFHTLSSFL